ncbi:hypothetical protein ACHAPJ_013241 [Fusarium lateritium]
MKTSILIFSPKGDTELILRRPNFRKRNEPKNKSTANGTAPDNEVMKLDDIKTENGQPKEDQPLDPDVYSDRSSSVHKIEDLKALMASDKKGRSVEIRLRVSSAHLILSSPVFKTMLDGPFSEGIRNKDNLFEVKAFEWNAEALVILLGIIHGHHKSLPQKVELDILIEIAMLCDYYQCEEIVDIFAERWITALGKDKPYEEEATLTWMFIAWKLEAQRLKVINDVLTNIYGLQESLWTTNDDCKPQCASMLLGSLMKQMREAGLEIPKSTGLLPSTIRILVGLRKFVSGLETPVWYMNVNVGYSVPTRHECSFQQKTKPWMDDMAKTYRDGFRFEDFSNALNYKALPEMK